MSKNRQDEFVDAWLSAALADLREETPRDVDWDGLHQRIQDRAELVFARQRKQRVPMVRRPYVPLALAASLALALWSGPILLDRILDSGGSTSIAADYDSDAVLREAFTAELTDEEAIQLLSGRRNAEVLLAAVVGR